MFFSKKLKSFKEINHCFFSRKSGYSKGLYKSLNCGRGSRDNKKNIYRNLRYVSKKMNLKNNELVLMVTHQVVISNITGITPPSGGIVIYNSQTRQSKQINIEY